MKAEDRHSFSAISALAVAACLGLLPSCGLGFPGGLQRIPKVVTCTVNAAQAGPSLAPLWGDHYDLSVTHLAYASEPGFLNLVRSLKPRSWRCSVGRWEIGMPPPPGGNSTDPAVLRVVDREYYRGPNTLLGADDSNNYDFTYLDTQLAAIVAIGAEPFLCFDSMPFTLSSEQDPFNPWNFGLADPSLSFSNGIRTAPPANPTVYARVVRNVTRHVRGLFGGTLDFGIGWIEIGNEPDLIDASGAALPYFWTGTRNEWIAMYAAIANELDSDPSITGLVRLGGGSFAFPLGEPAPTFLADFLADVAQNGRRLDFVSYHSYDDDPIAHLVALVRLRAVLTALGLNPAIVNGEWGRSLNGLDSVYGQLEHGLMRAKVIILMQVFGVRLAHESLYRDPGPGPGQLGLVRTSPAAPKPVSDVYTGLAKMNDSILALPIVSSPGSFFMAGTNTSRSKVVVVHPEDDPGRGRRTRIHLTVGSLPWGSALYDATRFVVSEATSSSGTGLAVDRSWFGLSGSEFQDIVTLGPGPGQGRFFVWELIRR